MKATIQEYDGCFSIHLEAETMVEAAQITRMGMNHRRELRSCEAYAAESGNFSLSCILPKATKASSQVPHLTR